ncbi:SH3 domain-containing protein [Tabrizicola aquatica]|uniref:SH3 domain-containing protein n=1 Tax=Tabrizicola aquatica TaxID=909926 RepID=UPI000CD1B7A4|nr:SH3 domain-containing protein [Tabrizicola aquatica]
MFRLTLLLCIGLFVALVTLGEDRGQLRPGLAQAAAEGRLDEVWAEARAKAERVSAPAPVAKPEPAPMLAALAPKPEPLAPAPAPVRVAEVIEPVVEVEPGREVVALVEEPVFSLASYGNEAVPGEAGAPLPEGAETMAAEAGSVWYVDASSVNVRAEPTTDSDVVGKLANGEAALMVAEVDGEWVRIVIQGDGLEGYVARRFLTAEAP